VLIFRPDGKLMIQQRSAGKDTFPLSWECVGGHLGPGEEYESAALREVQEEIGLALDSLEALACIPASAASGHEFIRVFRGLTVKEPVCHPGEIVDFAWVDPADLPRMIADSERKFSPVFVHTLRTISLI
jgi:isopentenyldiphosphate isomerase